MAFALCHVLVFPSYASNSPENAPRRTSPSALEHFAYGLRLFLSVRRQVTFFTSVVTAFRMAQEEDDFFASRKGFQDIVNTREIKDFTRQRFTPAPLALVIDVQLILVDNSVLNLSIVIALQAVRILFKVRRNAP